MTEATHSTYDVVIVGGGIAGLSIAWYLEQEVRAAQLDLRYTLLEASERWGGHILSEQVEVGGQTFVVEAGPDSFLTQKPAALQLAHELGLAARLLGTNDHMRQTYVLHQGKPIPLPDGVLLIVPTKFMPFVQSPLISLLGKLRMGMDLFIPRRRDGADETLADFVRRRLGGEALDKIAEPLLSGIYNAEAERQSLLATFPRFRALEEQYGSLTRGMLALRRAASNGHQSQSSVGAPAPNDQQTKPISAFMSLRNGTTELVNALVAQLTGELQLRQAVQCIVREADDSFLLTTAQGTTLRANALVLATPSFVAAGLLQDLAPELAQELNAIRYVSTGTISLAYRQPDIQKPYRGFGLVVPRSEHRPINAITWSSIKFDQRAPEGYALLRIFFGGSRSPQSMELDDQTLLDIVCAELRKLMGIESPPLFHRIYRWQRSNPQYDVGHLDRIQTIESSLPALLYLTGSAYRGVGIPDCIKQGQETAKRLITDLKALH
jgi:protoporphyrinogen/coproporphyrinogen III oxidase